MLGCIICTHLLHLNSVFGEENCLYVVADLIDKCTRGAESTQESLTCNARNKNLDIPIIISSISATSYLLNVNVHHLFVPNVMSILVFLLPLSPAPPLCACPLPSPTCAVGRRPPPRASWLAATSPIKLIPVPSIPGFSLATSTP